MGYRFVEEGPNLYRFVDESRPPPTLEQSAEASPINRVIRGMKDPIDAGAQFIANVLPSPVVNAVNRGVSAVNDLPVIGPATQILGMTPATGKEISRGIADDNARLLQARQAVSGREDPGFDWWRLGGNIFSPANAAVAKRLPIPSGASLPGLAGRGAVVGGIGGLLSPVDNPDASFGVSKALQVGGGMLGGAALTPPLAKFSDALASKVNQFVTSKVMDREVLGARASLQTDEVITRALAEIGMKLDDLPPGYLTQVRGQVVDALKSGKKLNAAALMRQDDFKQLGIPPTLGQITRDPMQFARERNLRAVQGAGEPLLNRFNEQNELLSSRIGAYGGRDAQTPFAAGEQLIGSLKASDDARRGLVSSAYSAARESTGREATVPMQGLAQDYANILRDYGDKNIPQAVARRLEEFGVSGGKQVKLFTAQDAEDLLQVINKNKSTDPAVNSAMGELRSAIKRAVTEGGDDVFSNARRLAKERFEKMDAIPALKAVVEGDASPDNFIQKFILNGKVNEVRNLSMTIGSEDRAEIRRQIASHLSRAAFGENPAGDKIFSPERFQQALRNIGPEKLGAFFSAGEVEQLQRVARVGAYINASPGAAPVMGNPNMFWAGALLDRIPGIGPIAGALRVGSREARNARDVSTALQAKVPQSAPDLSPEQQRALNQFLAAGGLLGGAALGSPF